MESLGQSMSPFGPVRLRRAGRGVLDLLFPRVCGLCGALEVDPHQALCEACYAGIERARSVPYCRKCGATIGPFGGTQAGCPSCRMLPLVTRGFARAGPFTGDLAELVRAYKFRGADYLDRCVGRLLADAVAGAAWLNEIDVLTWVPTCWQHRLKRRFHAASATAPHVARLTGLPLRPLLRRVKGGPHQVGLSRSERIENVKGKFKAVPGLALAGATVCLLDDVATSGATVNECARTLRAAGASKVCVAVVARAGGLDPIPKDA